MYNTEQIEDWQDAIHEVARRQEATATFPAPLEVVLTFSEDRCLHLKIVGGKVYLLPSGRINMAVERFIEITERIGEAHDRWVKAHAQTSTAEPTDAQ